jgi:uncharacterized membrane-anchored protein YjiN (DUF445 family)
VADQAATILASVVEALRDDEVQEAVEQAVARRIRKLDAGPLLGRALEIAVAEGRHQEVLSVLLHKVDEVVDANQVELRARLGRETPWWVPDAIDDRIYTRVNASIHRFLGEIADDPDHPVRHQVDERLQELAHQLASAPEMQERAEELKTELIEHPELRKWSSSVWTDLKASLLERAADPASSLRLRIQEGVASFGARLAEDETLQVKLDDWIVEAAGDVIEQSRDEIGELIGQTVARWDAEETGRRIELQVGRDLQFIRINGTVVGGLAGLAIFTVSRLLGG